MSVYRVIDKLEASVKQGTVLPLGYRIVSEEKLLELIEKLRASLPEEVGRAFDRQERRSPRPGGAGEAQAIVVEASTQQSQLLDDNEIMRRARATAEIVLREAEQKAARVREGADAYAAQVLTDLDVRLSGALGSVKKGIEALAIESVRSIGYGDGTGLERLPTRRRNRSAPRSTRRTRTRPRNSSRSNADRSRRHGVHPSRTHPSGTPERRRLRGLPAHGFLVGPSAGVPRVRPCRLLR